MSERCHSKHDWIWLCFQKISSPLMIIPNYLYMSSPSKFSLICLLKCFYFKAPFRPERLLVWRERGPNGDLWTSPRLEVAYICLYNFWKGARITHPKGIKVTKTQWIAIIWCFFLCCFFKFLTMIFLTIFFHYEESVSCWPWFFMPSICVFSRTAWLSETTRLVKCQWPTLETSRWAAT